MEMENGIEGSPDRSSSPTPFLGFTPQKEVKKEVIECTIIRMRQPRTTKSRASLVWQKAVTIKEEPEDEDEKKPIVKEKVGTSSSAKQKPSKSTKTVEKGFKCNQCGRIYKYLRGMRQHQRLECNVEPQFPCPYCPNKFRYRQGIREHVRTHHEQAFPKWYATHYVIPMLRQEHFTP